MNGDTAVTRPDQRRAPGRPPPPDSDTPPRVAVLPALVCLRATAPELPDAAVITTAVIAVIAVDGPDGATYRTGGRYAGLLRHKPHLPADHAHLVIRPTGQPDRGCDGGSLAALEHVPAHARDAELIRVVTPKGGWLGPLPWADDGTTPGAPPPVAYLDRFPAEAVVVLVEVVSAPRGWSRP